MEAREAIEKRDQLIDGIKPIIRELVELVKSFDTCLEESQSLGQIHIESATTAIKLLIPLQSRLLSLVEITCGGLGEFGIKMTGFVSYQFRASVNSLVESIKKAITTQNLQPFSDQMVTFRGYPKALVELIKSSNQVNEEISRREDLYNDRSDTVTKPQEKHLPKLVLVILDTTDAKTKSNQVNAIQAYFGLKDITKGVAFVKVRRREKFPIETSEPEIRDILNKFTLEDLPTMPAFIMIHKGNYYWFRNTVYKTQTIYNWIDDILNEMAYITGVIPWNNIPENVKYFWKKHTNCIEPMSKLPLKGGSSRLKNLISACDAPDLWNEMWFISISDDLTIIFLDNLLDFQKKFQRLLNPITVKPWNYKYIVPSPEWPGWSKLSNLKTIPIEKRQIETALLPIREYLVTKDENISFDKSQFYTFFEGEPEPEEPEVQEPVKYDISEFGDIGKISFNWNQVDEFALEKSKHAKPKASSKPIIRPVQRIPAPTKKDSNTVQDQIFDYLGEMLKNTAISDYTEEEKEEEIVDDIDLDNL